MEFNNYLGIHETALRLQAQRAEVLASNLANVDTPQYKARDIDFRQVLTSVDSEDELPVLQMTHSQHQNQMMDDVDTEMGYRVPYQPSLDGNTVEHQVEMAAYSDNAMRYLATLRFISGKLNTLQTAIRGQ